MILLKSILMGVGAALAAALAVGLVLQSAQYGAAISTAAGQPAPVQQGWHVWLVFGASVVAFAAGFWSQYRKAR